MSINFNRCTRFACHYFVATELCRRSHMPTHEFRVFDHKCSRFLWERDRYNSYAQHNGYGSGHYFWSRYQNHGAQLQQFPKTLLCPQRVWLIDFSIQTIQSSYNPAPAVCQLNRPHLQHHQSSLMLKILVRPVKAQLWKKWRAG